MVLPPSFRSAFSTAVDQYGVGIVVGLVTLFVPSIRSVLATLGGRMRLQTRLIWHHCSTKAIEYRKKDSDAEDEEVITVSGLYVYPVKSMRAVSLEEAVLDEKGFSNDRRVMLVTPLPSDSLSDATHRFLTQRTCPSLATVETSIAQDKNGGGNDILTLSYRLPGKDTVSLQVPLEPDSASTDTTILRARLWDDVVEVVDLGDAAAAFLQPLILSDPSMPDADVIKRQVRLVRQHPTDPRQTDPNYTPAATRALGNPATSSPVGLQDGFPLLVASEMSLQDLNRRIGEPAAALPMSRFRPNIVVQSNKQLLPDQSKAFAEDEWKVVRINGVLFHLVKGCPRCQQSCTDQTTGRVVVNTGKSTFQQQQRQRQQPEPLNTLATFRATIPDRPTEVYFGQNATAGPGAAGRCIRVGDIVEVVERGAPVWNK